MNKGEERARMDVRDGGKKMQASSGSPSYNPTALQLNLLKEGKKH